MNKEKKGEFSETVEFFEKMINSAIYSTFHKMLRNEKKTYLQNEPKKMTLFSQHKTD